MANASTAPDSLFVGSGKRPANLILRYANRHGLIAGATGTGKTVSLQVLAEAARREAAEKEEKKSGRIRQTAVEAGIQSMVRTIGRAVGRELVRGVLGSFFRRR